RAAECVDRLERENDNFRAALEWALGEGPPGQPRDAPLGLRLAGALAWFWHFYAHLGEGRDWLSAALGVSSRPDAARLRALHGAGWLAHIQSDTAAARALLEEALPIARALDDGWAVAWVL